MKTWLANKWSTLRTNFWVIPGAMAALAVVLSLMLLFLDNRVIRQPFTMLRAGSLEGVRTLLGVLIGALVTSVSIVFSTTVVVLTLAASQLGPRLLRTYVRDRNNQVLLGVFIATLFYCLTALFVVGRMEGSEGLPNLTVLGAFALTCASLIVLVYFIHHVALSIQAPNVIIAVSTELNQLIERTYPEEQEDEAPVPVDKKDEEDLPPESASVFSKVSGYLQAVDEAGLMRIAREGNLLVVTHNRPGHYVMEGCPLAKVYSAAQVQEGVIEQIRSMFAWTQEKKLEAGVIARIQAKFIMGARRTATQDVEFVLLELVEIAVRALSPGINDPFTAVTCIDRLAEALRLLVRRHMPTSHRYDDERVLRLILEQTSFEGICAAAFNQIRQHAGVNVTVLIHLMDAIRLVLVQARTEKQEAVLWRHACMVRRAAKALPEQEDRDDVEERFQMLVPESGNSGEETE
jgi:uncharacterized membrane protein